MNEESDTHNIDGVVQSAPMASLNEEMATKIGGNKSNDDKMATVSEDDRVAQLTKELEQCRKERDRYKVAHQTSETEKKELITKMEYEDKLKSKEIDILKTEKESLRAKLHYEAKLKSFEIENFKRESDILNEKLQASREEIDRCKHELDSYVARVTEIGDEMKSKSAEIENLKSSEAETESLITKMDCDYKVKCMEIEILEEKIENESKLKAVEIENLKVTHANAEVEWQARIDKMECAVNSKAKEIECLQKMECEWKSRISQLEDEVEKRNDEINITPGYEQFDEILRSLRKTTTADTTIRWRFTEISKLTAEAVYSQPTECAGVTWMIRVEKLDDHLGIYLEGTKFGAAKWSCAVTGDLQLLSQKDNSIVKHRQVEQPHVYDEATPGKGWGFPKVMQFEDLLKGDAVKDDSVIVAVAIKVFSSSS